MFVNDFLHIYLVCRGINRNFYQCQGIGIKSEVKPVGKRQRVVKFALNPIWKYNALFLIQPFTQKPVSVCLRRLGFYCLNLCDVILAYVMVIVKVRGMNVGYIWVRAYRYRMPVNRLHAMRLFKPTFPNPMLNVLRVHDKDNKVRRVRHTNGFVDGIKVLFAYKFFSLIDDENI